MRPLALLLLLVLLLGGGGGGLCKVVLLGCRRGLQRAVRRLGKHPRGEVSAARGEVSAARGEVSTGSTCLCPQVPQKLLS